MQNSTIKSFNQDYYNSYDRAKLKLSGILRGTDYYIDIPDDKYTVDLYLFYREEHIKNVEVEVKLGWVDWDYPFKDVRIAFRKNKFTKLEKPTIFCMFNKPLTRHLVIPDIIKGKVELVDNKEMDNEKFFVLDLKDVKFDYFNEI